MFEKELPSLYGILALATEGIAGETAPDTWSVTDPDFDELEDED